MKFSLTPVFALALVAQATNVQRDLKSIQGVLSDIGTQVDALDKAVTSFSGDPTALLAAGQQLLSTIKSGVSTVSASAPLDITDATQVAQGSIALNQSTTNVVNDLIAKKQALVAANVGPGILKSLQDQKAASGSLAEAITSKVPTALQPTAQGLSQGVGDSLQRGIAAYQGVGSSPAPSSTNHGNMSMPTSSATKPAGNSTVVSPTPSGSKPAGSSGTVKPASSGASPTVYGFSGAFALLAIVLAF